MKSRALAAAALAALALGAGAAFAKAPKPADMPSVEDVFQQAKQAIEEQKAKASAQTHDPLREAIENYKDKKKSQLTEWQLLTGCIHDPTKSEADRSAATQSLIARFQNEDERDPLVLSTRRQIANAILDLMKADAKKDQVGLEQIEIVINTWWRPQNTMDVKFKATASLADRKRSYDKLKKFLGKGQD